MVKSNEITLIKVAALFLAIGVVLFAPIGVAASDDFEEATAPVSDDDDDYSINSLHLDGLLDMYNSPEPSPGYYKFLEQCAKKLNSEECGKEIFAGMFYEEPLTKPCCTRLVAMGRECHDALVEKLIDSPELKPLSPKVLLRSAQIWDACDYIAQSPYSSIF
ncbi:Prolamin-like domain [Sesbania bispinosa]|nr:Prolamin-like domain [Sesbania bispinosa]